MGAGAQTVAVARLKPMPKAQVKLTGKVRAFLEVLRQKAGVSRTEAARMVGFAEPRAAAVRISQKHAQLVAEAEAEGLKGLKVSADEAEQIAAEIARDRNHRDRLKATEMFLKMHGKLSDKLTVTFDRTQLNQRLDELLQQMAEQRAVDISAQHTPAKQLPEPLSDDSKS